MVLPLSLGLNTNVSALVPVSGTSQTGTSGPWFIEQQDLTIYYSRVPTYLQGSTSYSLSGPTRDTLVTATRLQALVIANYSVVSSNDMYNGDWTQGQTFEYFPDANDQFGNSYGAVGVSALGPQGGIQTRIPWYKRRLWNSVGSPSGPADVEVSNSCVASNTYFRSTPFVHAGTPIVPPPIDAVEFWDDWTRGSSDWEPGTWLHQGQHRRQVITPSYTLFGTYSTDDETPALMENFVDQIGFRVGASVLFGVGPSAGGSGLTAGTGTTAALAVQDTGCPGYSFIRHLW